MSGTTKKGLDWAGWDTRICEDDERIDKLVDSQGWAGFGIYFYLCQKGYATGGYFYRWTFENSATTARKMGGGIKSETVKQVVSLCLRIGLFDNRLFEEEGILTNKEMQERFMIAVKERSDKGKTVEQKYWLLNPEDTKAYIIVSENGHSLPENAHSLPENNTKESKVKKSKVNESRKCVSPTLAEIQNYCLEKNYHFSPERFFNYYEAVNWKIHGTKITNWQRKADNWEATEKSNPKSQQHTSNEAAYDLDEYDRSSVVDEMDDWESEDSDCDQCK